MLHEFGNGTTLDALRADKQRCVCATADCNSQALEIWLELATGDARHLRADAAKVFRLAANGDAVSHRETLAANLTGPCHVLKLFVTKEVVEKCQSKQVNGGRPNQKE
jgi:hypothetical protein